MRTIMALMFLLLLTLSFNRKAIACASEASVKTQRCQFTIDAKSDRQAVIRSHAAECGFSADDITSIATLATRPFYITPFNADEFKKMTEEAAVPKNCVRIGRAGNWMGVNRDSVWYEEYKTCGARYKC